MMEIRLPAEPATTTRPSAEPLRCPRCETELSERCDFGWCQRCGYCRYMEKRKIVPADVVRARRDALLHAATHRLLPTWLSVLVCGMLACVVSTAAAALNVRDDPRSLHAWYAAQAMVAGLLLIMGHVTAFLRLVPADQRRKHASLFISSQLWWAVWRRLPATQSSAWLAGWGLTLALGTAAVYLIDGGWADIADWLAH
jgi:hypothetical protein